MKLKEIAFAIFGFFVAGSTGYTAAHISMAVAARIGWDSGWWGFYIGGIAMTATLLILAQIKSN